MPIRLLNFKLILNKMRFVFLLFTGFVLLGCDVGTTEKKPQKETVTSQVTPSLKLFADTLKRLNSNTPTVLDSAVRLYDVTAPVDSSGADSAAVLLLNFVQKIVAKRNDSLQNDGADYLPLLEPSDSSLTEKQKAISSELHKAKLKPVGDGEGGIYLVPAYETVLPVVKAKTSTPVDNYLDLIAKEDTMPSFLDAGLAIEITELVDRLILSENLLAQKLPESFATDASRLNRFYTNNLIRGADNSPALEDNELTLTEQFRQGYDYLLTKYPESKAAAKINVWTAVIKSGDKKKVDDYLKLLND